MKILLINPNRVLTPPVPPLGLEHVAACLEKDGHMVRMADLCFSENIFAELDRAMHSMKPEFVGITVRNVDSVLYYDNNFYLREIKAIVTYLKSSFRTRVLLGGAGLMTNPEGVLAYLEADYAYIGPAGEDLNAFLKQIPHALPGRRIWYGHRATDCSMPGHSFSIDYRKYYDQGGIGGFATHRGCSSSCVYCIEANTKVSFFKPECIIKEIAVFVDSGYRHLHLCDSEFNEDLEFSLAFCSALQKSGLNIQWAVYMKPANYNGKLFRMMKETGVYLITLTVDTYKKCPLYWSDVEKMVYHAKSGGISIAVDLLTGFPYEDETVVCECLDFFRRLQPDAVTINTFIRLYQSTQISKIIANDRSLSCHLHGDTDDLSMVNPVFYGHMDEERLKELIQGDAVFSIAGRDKGVNYCRFGKNGVKGC